MNMIKGEAEINGVRILIKKSHFRITPDNFLLLTEKK